MVNISVIIPSYNPGDYVFECLDSCLKQTLDKTLFEVIIVLNGDKYPYWDDICTYVKQYDNVRVVHEELPNVSNARNKGMEIAIGEYFCFIDDDDIVSPNYLEELFRVSTPKKVGVSNIHSFRGTIDNWNNDFFACRIIQQRDSSKSLFGNRAILSFPVAKLIHRGIVGSRKYDLRFKNGEDALFMTQISDKIHGFAFTDESACYFVRERNESATRKKIDKKVLIKNTFLLLSAYFITYISKPFSYNFLLFLSRVPGVLKGNIKLIIRNMS